MLTWHSRGKVGVLVVLLLLDGGATGGCRCTSPAAEQAQSAAEQARPVSPKQSRRSPRARAKQRPAIVLAAAKAFASAPTAAQALLAGERLKYARLAVRLKRFGAQARRPAAALPTLAADTALLSFVVHGGKLHRFVSLAGQTRRLRPLPLGSVEALVIGARDAIEYGPLLEVAPLWKRLHRAYRGLLLAAQPELDRARRLLVASDGLLDVLPLHALVLEVPAKGEAPRFVLQRWEIAYTPSALLIRGGPLELQHAVLLAPAYGRRRARRALAGALAESKAIEAAFSGAALQVRRAAAATPKALLAALHRRRAAVHFAGHGLADLRPGSPPELLFPDVDPGVTVGQLGSSPVAAELVVLASCTGAYAARFRNDERRVAETNPTEALLAAGARTVIAASWSVKDKQSAVQLATFYRQLRKRGPCASLAAAQRERIARLRPPHPRFWAFYACYGDLGVPRGPH